MGPNSQVAEEQRKGGERKVLQGEPMERTMRAAANGEAQEDEHVRESKQCTRQPDVQQQVTVQRGAVQRGVGGEEPTEGLHGGHRLDCKERVSGCERYR